MFKHSFKNKLSIYRRWTNKWKKSYKYWKYWTSGSYF